MADLATPAAAQGRTPLHLAARHAGSDAAGALGDLLAAGGAVEAADAAGATPLLAALAENRRDAVGALLDAGACPGAGLRMSRKRPHALLDASQRAHAAAHTRWRADAAVPEGRTLMCSGDVLRAPVPARAAAACRFQA